MTDQLDTAVIQAGFDLLRADALTHFQDGQVANGTPRPYILGRAWCSRPEEADSNALDGRSRTIWVRWYLECVGDTRESATAMQQRARTQMLDQQLVLVGYPNVALTLIKEDAAEQPIPADETTGQAVFSARTRYRVRVTTT